MKRRTLMQSLGAAGLFPAALWARTPHGCPTGSACPPGQGGGGGGGGGGAVQQFNFLSFNSSNIGTNAGQIHFSSPGDSSLNGNGTIQVIPGGNHISGNVWYVTPQTITTFTCSFTFSIHGNTTSGLTFIIQNTNASTQDNTYGPHYGINANADANAMSYGTYAVNPEGTGIQNSIAIGFTGASQIYGGQGNPPGIPDWSLVALYTEGGPLNPMVPQEDLLPYGLHVSNGNEFLATLVYDGTILTMTLQDLTTLAIGRFRWPVKIPVLMQGNGIPPVNTGTSSVAWIGFGASEPHSGTGGGAVLYNWNYFTNYNTRLATPTFNPPGGSYSGTQTVAISVPPGSTVYYTTNGLLPTSASTRYTGPISVSSNTALYAVAISHNYTDSYVAGANYAIGTANYINYSSFAGSSAVVCCGNAAIVGSQLRITDTTHPTSDAGETGAAWYGLQVPITGNWTTTFQLQWNSAAGNGMGFIIQNQDTTVGNNYTWNNVVSGGPNCLLLSNLSGYTTRTGVKGLNTGVLIFFDLYNAPNSVGLYHPAPTTPTGSQTGTGLTFNGNTYNVTVSYNASTTTLTLTMGSFTKQWTINIPTAVNASANSNSAYVGFAGFCGGATANQYVNNWTFTP